MSFGSRCAFEQMILLAPPSSQTFTVSSQQVDASQHAVFLKEAQRLRGRIYLEDGAVDRRQLSADGRLIHTHDERGWHLLLMNRNGRVAGCARYVVHDDDVSFSEFGVATAALAYSPNWSFRLREAVEAQRAKARARGMAFAEVGGWVLDEELRFTTAAREIFFNVCGLARLLGGAVAITTATFRHHSSSILRKLGGRGLVSDGVELPSYYDPQYECEMEILCFDSDYPTPKYVEHVQQCEWNLADAPVVCPLLRH